MGDVVTDGHQVITEYLKRDLLRFTTAGSVDDGKSTLIGRLLFDSKAIFQDQMEQLEQASTLRGEEQVNLALLTDGLRAEREQGITIDVAYRYFATPGRKFIIADTPGHEQYTRNMVTGASSADLAIILIDARNGVLTQSKRHGIIASLLGIPHLVVAVNKMDLVNFRQDRFAEIVEEYTEFSRKLDIHDIEFIPISALLGDNVVDRSQTMTWYQGPTVLSHLENVVISADRNLVDFRLPVQTVIRPNQDFRGFAGTIASGAINTGDEIIALPTRRRSRVREVHLPDGPAKRASAGQAVVVTLEDEVDIARGDMIVRAHNVPDVESEFEAILCWMDDERDLAVGGRYLVQHTSRTAQASISRLRYRIDVNTLHRQDAESLSLNEIGRVTVSCGQPIFHDGYDRNRQTGGFILIDPASHRTVAAGMIRTRSEAEREIEEALGQADGAPVSSNITEEQSKVTPAERSARNGHAPHVFWFTGMSGSGKSTLALELERRLFDSGVQVIRLDGDNVRHGLNRDLGFSENDRHENLRRVSEAAKLFHDAGFVVICTFVSPFRRDRDFARSLVPADHFTEISVSATIDTLRKRDPKGLYEKQASGELLGLTGIDAPYEAPVNPELAIDTGETSVEASLAIIEKHIATQGLLDKGR